MKTSYTSYFNPYSQEHRSLETFSKLPTIHKVGIVFATILASIITVGIASCATFRGLVEYASRFSSQCSIDNTIKNAIAEADHNKLHYEFRTYSLKNIGTPPAKETIDTMVNSTNGNQLIECEDRVVSGIGKTKIFYAWNQKPTGNFDLDKAGIKDEKVCLPKKMTFNRYVELRIDFQLATIKNDNRLTDDIVYKAAISLGGMTIQATMPFNANALLPQDSSKNNVQMHAIYQSGLNFAGPEGGGVSPLNNFPKASEQITSYSQANTDAAVQAAVDNGSDVLVYSIGIGTGAFGGSYSNEVLQANIDGICSSVKDKKIKVLVPNIQFSLNQQKQIRDAGISIINYDKDKIAALLASKGLKVSVTIAADPMSMLGIHGPGLWWKSVGLKSDEERSAHISPCYLLGYMPIEVVCRHHSDLDMPRRRITAISEYLYLKP